MEPTWHLDAPNTRPFLAAAAPAASYMGFQAPLGQPMSTLATQGQGDLEPSLGGYELSRDDAITSIQPRGKN